MLVITRKDGEMFKIGEDIEITIVDIHNGKIRIGIDAPKDMKILRKEIITAVKAENLNAGLKNTAISLEQLNSTFKRA